MKKFNINNNVKVKLTDIGRKMIVDQYTECLADSREEIEQSVITDKTDADGYTRLQMWRFMGIFGDLVGNPFRANAIKPFEMDILIDETDLEDVTGEQSPEPLMDLGDGAKMIRKGKVVRRQSNGKYLIASPNYLSADIEKRVTIVGKSEDIDAIDWVVGE